MLADILQSAKQSLTERFASPLMGSFVISWCLWNWKFLVILFSNASVSQTFALIEKVSFPNTEVLVTRGILYPLLTAAVYIFVYPYPAKLVYAYTLRRQREINQIKQSIADETPLTLEESRRLRAEYIEHERKNTEVIGKLNDEIARLNAALDAVNRTQFASSPSPTERMNITLEPSQLHLLRLIEKAGGTAFESSLIEESTESKVKTEFDIGELVQKRLLDRNYDQRMNEYSVGFTHEGRRALIEETRLEHIEAGD